MLTTLATIADPQYRRELGNGLIVRWSTAKDIEDIAYLASFAFRLRSDAPLNMQMSNLMRELLSGHHPVTGPEDVAVVEDTRREEHPLVSMTFLWRQQWAYEGIPFTIGRPEIVATDPAYRNRGLVRTVFELVHARSQTEGHLVQAITGIPYFYRQFGYEYALDLDERNTLYTVQIPESKADHPELYSLREATFEDMPLLQTLYAQQKAAYSVTTPIDEKWWHYQIETKNKVEDDGFWYIHIIVDRDGNAVGYVVLPMTHLAQSIVVSHLTVASTVNLQAAMPSLLRAIQAQKLRVAASAGAEPVKQIIFALGRKHAAYEVLGKELKYSMPYAWYVRVPNLPQFLWLIAPALERRLAHSALVGYSGSLNLNFYRGGLRLVFEKGRLAAAEDWRSSLWGHDENAGFPPLVFLQLLFGRRSLDELRYAFPDVFANDDAELVLKILFPSSPSWAIPLG